MTSPTAPPDVPLCVDLDGTLITGDTLVISLRLLAREHPFALPLIAFALLRGRAAFKDALSRRVVPRAADLPWRTPVVEWVRQQKAGGRVVYLTTAAHERIATEVASHLGCFDGIVASDEGENAKGAAKVTAIRRCLAGRAFDYVGDSTADIPVFQAARRGYLVAPSAALRAALQGRENVETLLDAG